MAIEAIIPNVLTFVKVASALTNKAMGELSQNRQAQKAASDKMEPTLAQLIESGSIKPEQKQAAAALLGTHAGALDMLQKANIKIAQLKKDLSDSRSTLGAPVTDKQAGVAPENRNASLTSPFVGQRTSEKRASDYAMLAVLDDPR
jgi:hypothetical protein